MRRNLSQIERISSLIAYSLILWTVNCWLFQELIPTGLWFWSAILALLLSEFIAQPYFTSPRDALSNAIAASATSTPLVLVGTIPEGLKNWWITFSILTVIILLISIFAMLLGEHANPLWERIGKSLTRISRYIGSPRFLFTIIFFLILATFHDDRNEVFWLTLTWTVIVLGHPIENGFLMVQKLRELWKDVSYKAQVIGRVVARTQPDLLTIQIANNNFPSEDSLLVIPIDSNFCQLGVVIDNYRLSDNLWSRVLIFEDRVSNKDITGIWGHPNIALKVDDGQVAPNLLENETYKKREQIIGSVIEQSDISIVRIELFRDNTPISEGNLISIKIGDKDVLYQIINGVTESEILQSSNRHGFMQIEARKLGLWNETKHHFEQIPWTPQIYTPAYLKKTSSQSFTKEYIGFIPQTSYGIKVSTKELVTHNTAILGVLGSGKTSLAIELILRMLNDNVKVWIIDITGQYEGFLEDYVDIHKQNKADITIKNAIKSNASKMEKNKVNGGNYRQFSEQLREHIQTFLADENWCVRVFNPNNYKVTEQTSNPYNNEAGFGDLTVTQMTRIVTEELLHCLQGTIEDKAKLCLVLEEAHSLVPEWNSVAYEGDQNATNGTAKAILQGRKYGFGCLLITQRTANVTKSILNQCNTILGLRVFDDTGKGFLSNYIGSDYASLLSTLPDRHCIVFGRGVNAQSPLLIKLNDYKMFSDNFEVTANCKDKPQTLDDIPF